MVVVTPISMSGVVETTGFLKSECGLAFDLMYVGAEIGAMGHFWEL